MTNETEDNREPQSRSLSGMTVVVWLFELQAVYVLSTGPVIAIWLKFEWDLDYCQFFYAPLIALYDLNESSWFARGLDWWLGLWGVK